MVVKDDEEVIVCAVAADEMDAENMGQERTFKARDHPRCLRQIVASDQ